MSRLNRPLRLWHALLATVAVFAIGVAGTAIAVGGKKAPSAGSAKVNLGSSHGYVYVSKTGDQFSAGETNFEEVKCPKHSVVTGGGVYISGSSLEAHVNTSYPQDIGDGNDTPEDGWGGHVANNAGNPKDETAYAVCKKF
jgi:hypothetical protein